MNADPVAQRRGIMNGISHLVKLSMVPRSGLCGGLFIGWEEAFNPNFLESHIEGRAESRHGRKKIDGQGVHISRSAYGQVRHVDKLAHQSRIGF